MFNEDVLQTGINQERVPRTTSGDISSPTQGAVQSARQRVQSNLDAVEAAKAPVTPDSVAQSEPPIQPATPREPMPQGEGLSPSRTLGPEYLGVGRDLQATRWDAAKATARQWGASNIIGGLIADLADSSEVFGDPEEDFNLVDSVSEYGLDLSDGEFQYLKDRQIQNRAELNYHLTVLLDRRADYFTASHYGGTSLLTGMIDPLDWVVAGGSLKVAGSLARHRAGSAFTAGLADAGATQVHALYNPEITWGDTAAAAAFGAAFGTAFPNRPAASRRGDTPEVEAVPEAPDAPIAPDASRSSPEDLTEEFTLGIDHSTYTTESTLRESLNASEASPGINITSEEELLNLTQQLRGDSSTSGIEVAPDGSLRVQGSTPEEALTYRFGEETYIASPEYTYGVDPYGEGYSKATGKVQYESPTAHYDVTGIRQESLHPFGESPLSPDPSVRNWLDLEDGWEVRSNQYHLPDSKDINWERVSDNGVALKDSAVAPMYRALESGNVSPALKQELAYQLKLGGEILSRTAYKTYRKPIRTPEGKNVQGMYSPSKGEIQVRQGDPETQARTTAHEAMHALTYSKVEYGLKNPESVHGKLVQEVGELRELVKRNIKEQSLDKHLSRAQKFELKYFLSSPHEFLAKLSEIGSKSKNYLADILESIEVPQGTIRDNTSPNSRNAFTAILDAFRKLLGLNISRGNALYKALGIRDKVLKYPEVQITMPDGSVRSVEVGSPTQAQDVYLYSLEEVEQLAEEMSKTLGRKVEWSGFKDFYLRDPEFAEQWLSDPKGTNPGNITSLKRAYQSEMEDRFVVVWEKEARAEMKRRGIKLWYDPYLNPAKTRQVQEGISIEIHEALTKISEGASLESLNLSPGVRNMVKTMDEFGLHSRDLLVQKGLLPEAVLQGTGGYYPRKWNGVKVRDIIDEIAPVYFEGDRDKALHFLGQQVGKHVQYTGITDRQRTLYGKAIVTRALRQADNLDIVFRGHLGMDTAYEMRQILKDMNADPKDVRKIMDLVTGKIDEAGKERWQKTRMDIRMTGQLRLPNGEVLEVHDLLDKSNIFQDMNRYMEDVTGRLAIADHGFLTTSDIDKARQSFVNNATKGKHRLSPGEANQWFDNIVDSTLGRPVGGALHWFARVISGMTQLVALRNSPFWQIPEFSLVMTKSLLSLGFKDTYKALNRAFKNFKAAEDPQVARELNHILTRKGWNSTRLRPLVNRFEDGHTHKSDGLSAVQSAQSAVYYMNGMVWIQRLQAGLAAEVAVISLQRASAGDAKLAKYFKRYGVSDKTLQEARREIDLHGLDVDKWDAELWNSKLNPALTEIMDTNVLRSKTGEVPVFFQFSETGRMLGTFQNFTLTAHNKIMANTLYNDGIKTFATLLAINLPLAMLATQVSSVSGGRGWIDNKSDWIAAALGQMGSFGIFVEVFNMITGNSQGLGDAMTISINKAHDILGKVLQGDFTGAADSAVKNIPLISLMPGYGLTYEALKELFTED